MICTLTGGPHVKTHTTTPTVKLDAGSLVGEVGFSTTITHEFNEPRFIYAFTDTGNDETRNGIGVNSGGWIGAEIGSSSAHKIFADIQLTPKAHLEGTLGLDGISLTTGITLNHVSHDFTFRVGWGAIAAAYVLPKIVAIAFA